MLGLLPCHLAIKRYQNNTKWSVGWGDSPLAGRRGATQASSHWPCASNLGWSRSHWLSYCSNNPQTKRGDNGLWNPHRLSILSSRDNQESNQRMRKKPREEGVWFDIMWRTEKGELEGGIRREKETRYGDKNLWRGNEIFVLFVEQEFSIIGQKTRCRLRRFRDTSGLWRIFYIQTRAWYKGPLPQNLSSLS